MKKCLLCCCLLVFMIFPGQVLAAEEETTASANLKTDLIWQRDSLDAEITTVKATYQAQLEDYLYQDKLYRIAYDQYQELQTLASIEDLTQKAKNLGISRDKVLTSYFTLLKLELIATEGIELTLKNEALDKLETTLAYLESHQTSLNNVNDREQVGVLLTTFTTDQEDISDLASEVLVLLAVGNLQIVYDKAIVLKTDIDNYLGEQGTLNLPAIERASNETNNSLASAKLKLDSFWSEVMEKRLTNSKYLARFYDDLPSTLNPLYVNLSQSISYLSELLST